MTADDQLDKTWPPARWRTGRRVGRTIYIQLEDEAGEHDVLVGLMDTRELATLAVSAVNHLLGVDARRAEPDQPASVDLAGDRSTP